MASSPLITNYDFLLRRPSALLESQYEDAVLSVGAAMTAVEFRDAVDTCMHLALLDVKHSLVLMLDLETNELGYFQSETEILLMPKSGILWEVVRRRNLDFSKAGIPADDPVRTLLPRMGVLERDQIVVLTPIVEKKGHRVVALLMAVCEELSLMHHEKLRVLERNVLVAASRVLKHTAIERERNRAESMLRVCGDLIDLDIVSLSIKILKHLKQIINAEVCAMFICDDATNELVCQVFNETPLDKEIHKSSTDSIYGRCMATGETLNIPDISKDARFNPEVDLLNDYEPSTMLVMPVKVTREGEKPIAIAVACNKLGNRVFTTQDEERMAFVLRFCASVLANTLAYQREKVLKKQNEALLQVARNLFNNLSDLDVLLYEIMNEARSLTSAEKCSLFLLDPSTQELVATVFDSDLPDEKVQKPPCIPVGQGIAGFVAKTGKVVNIRDAYKHPKFFRDVDKTTGFHTRNILCFPIMSNTEEVIGVAELCNKIGGRFFTNYDEELARTFSVYCGISIYHSKLYNKMVESRGRSKLASELMIYHMKITPEEVDKVVKVDVLPCSSYHQRMTEFTYSPMNVPVDDTVVAVISMAREMGLVKRWSLPTETLARFVLMVQKGYRNPPYHNWYHAFSVSHFCYVLHQNCKQLSFLTDLEILALFFSCLCHDIDHRGTNNAFQVSSNSVLASLYHTEGSVLEKHHFTQTICILNSEGCNIFEGLSPEDYKKVLDLIQANILATDIAIHLKKMTAITQMGKTGYESSNPEHHELLCSLLMTSCDLSQTCKDWESCKFISDLLYQEFFSQGDLEKALGMTPTDMMDRERGFIPELQLGFLDGIAGPVYKVLSEVLPQAGVAYDSLLVNRARWTDLKREGKKSTEVI